MKQTPLSAMGHVFTGTGSHPIEFVFAYGRDIDSVRLQSSLEETLDAFPLLGNEIQKISERTYGFRPHPRGLSLQTARSPVSFDDAENSYAFLDPVESVEGEPLTRIKLTRTPKGSVLGVSISHTLVDGFSYFHFLSSWSRIFNGNDIVPPVHQREFLLTETSDYPHPVTRDDVLAQSGLFLCDERPELSRNRIRWERFLLSRRMLHDLLMQARNESGARLSYNDVITAHLWKKYAHEWGDGRGGSRTFVTCPVDMRRIPATLPKTYFGCAVCLVTTAMDRQELAASPLGKAALAVRTAVGKVNRSYALGSLEILEALRRQEGLAVIEKIHVMHPVDGLLVTNISRLPVGDFDFGVGPPLAYRILTPAQRAAVILPAEDGVEIRVCHPPDGFRRVGP